MYMYQNHIHFIWNFGHFRTHFVTRTIHSLSRVVVQRSRNDNSGQRMATIVQWFWEFSNAVYYCLRNGQRILKTYYLSAKHLRVILLLAIKHTLCPFFTFLGFYVHFFPQSRSLGIVSINISVIIYDIRQCNCRIKN